jgi:hypothetical protein
MSGTISNRVLESEGLLHAARSHHKQSTPFSWAEVWDSFNVGQNEHILYQLSWNCNIACGFILMRHSVYILRSWTGFNRLRTWPKWLRFYEHWLNVSRNSIIFRGASPCSSMKFHRHFGETYRLHLQGRRGSQTWNQQEANIPRS